MEPAIELGFAGLTQVGPGEQGQARNTTASPTTAKPLCVISKKPWATSLQKVAGPGPVCLTLS
jgi:hypothetical protein